MPSSIPWPRGRRGLAGRSRWEPCTFYFPFTFARPRAGYRGRNQFHAEPGFLLPPSLLPRRAFTASALCTKARSFTARGPFRLGTGTLARTPKNKTRRGGYWSSAVALLGLAWRTTVRMALVPATVAIVIHSTAAENKGRNGHGESDFHVGAFQRVARDSLRAPLLGACKPLLATPAWMRLHRACMLPPYGAAAWRRKRRSHLPPASHADTLSKKFIQAWLVGPT